jgi:hypothetical protein
MRWDTCELPALSLSYNEGTPSSDRYNGPHSDLGQWPNNIGFVNVSRYSEKQNSSRDPTAGGPSVCQLSFTCLGLVWAGLTQSMLAMGRGPVDS